MGGCLDAVKQCEYPVIVITKSKTMIEVTIMADFNFSLWKKYVESNASYWLFTPSVWNYSISPWSTIIEKNIDIESMEMSPLCINHSDASTDKQCP